MKKVFCKMLVVALTLSTFSLAYAQDGLYVGANISQINYKEDGISTIKPIALSLKLGNQFTKNFALEARIGTGISDDSLDVFGTSVKVEVDSFYGIYGKGILPLNDNFSVYGLAGYTKGELTASAPGVGSFSESDSDFSFGVGCDYFFAENVAFNFEYARLFSGSDYTVNAPSMGITLKFK